ncbi:Head-specific guanylate cyclase [Orchesella cincta]|uniref:guanylate cyclase n=1 Tax=Orchesella cincta TaxID=48709 RepID=A0A1D2NMR1_ORCCI|nr:Head-specific guanylate cyclase [Orchesella cincta]
MIELEMGDIGSKILMKRLAIKNNMHGENGISEVELDAFTRVLGESYFSSCASRYKRAYRSLGPDFGKFLINLDGVLEALKHSNQGMAGMGDIEETIITTKEPATWDHELMPSERYTVVYKTTSCEQLTGTLFQSILSSVCTNLYASSDCTSSAIEINLKSGESSANGVDNESVSNPQYNVALSDSPQPASSSDKPTNVVQFLFIYDIKLHSKASSILSKTNVDTRQHLGINTSMSVSTAPAAKRKPDVAALKKLSTNPRDLGISVSLFSRAFPWHFVLDRQLRIVQLGSSLLKLFAPSFIHNVKYQQLLSEGYKVTEFFEFVRPDLGSEICFETVFQRLNTPFLFRLRNLATNYGSLQLAEE